MVIPTCELLREAFQTCKIHPIDQFTTCIVRHRRTTHSRCSMFLELLGLVSYVYYDCQSNIFLDFSMNKNTEIVLPNETKTQQFQYFHPVHV